jgi:hypothetical protein
LAAAGAGAGANGGFFFMLGVRRGGDFGVGGGEVWGFGVFAVASAGMEWSGVAEWSGVGSSTVGVTGDGDGSVQAGGLGLLAGLGCGLWARWLGSGASAPNFTQT